MWISAGLHVSHRREYHRIIRKIWDAASLQAFQVFFLNTWVLWDETWNYPAQANTRKSSRNLEKCPPWKLPCCLVVQSLKWSSMGFRKGQTMSRKDECRLIQVIQLSIKFSGMLHLGLSIPQWSPQKKCASIKSRPGTADRHREGWGNKSGGVISVSK